MIRWWAGGLNYRTALGQTWKGSPTSSFEKKNEKIRYPEFGIIEPLLDGLGKDFLILKV
jgi:hypothetical protein